MIATNKNLHIPVLLNEAIKALNIKKDGIYVDCTSGRGGHSAEILKNISSKGLLICIDMDQDAIDFLNKKFKNNKNVIIEKSNFSNIEYILGKNNIKQVDGVLLDLGVSSPMYYDTERGFSVHGNAPLDMRMDKENSIDAKYVVNNYSKEQLIKIFREYGDVINPIPVVNNIIKERNNKEISTTSELVEIIKKSLDWKTLKKEKHPARVYFQALRIEVNKEIENLETVLKSLKSILKPNGVAVIITFHSIEDRIVKNYFSNYSKSDIPLEVPIIDKPKFKFDNKFIVASEKEVLSNQKARSAKLRRLIKND